MPYTLFQGGRRRRRRRAPAVILVAAAAGRGRGRDRAVAARANAEAGHGPVGAGARPRSSTRARRPLAGGGTAPSPLAVRLEDPRDPIRLRFKHSPRAGLLFDIDTGRVLWRHAPTRVLPIASLTKMMTALVVTDRVPPGAKVRITKEALHYQGSGVGLLPRGKWIGVNTMLHGLLLPSGNDAAIALAQRAGRTVPSFVGLMNQRAHRMGLLCTRYSSPDGFKDRGNHSCASDLAAHRPRGAARAAAGADRAPPRGGAPVPDQGPQALPLQLQPAAAQGYRGIDGSQDGLHRRGRPLPGRDRAPRPAASSASCCCTRPTPPARPPSCSTGASAPSTDCKRGTLRV